MKCAYAASVLLLCDFSGKMRLLQQHLRRGRRVVLPPEVKKKNGPSVMCP